jgi:hypothetical protein
VLGKGTRSCRASRMISYAGMRDVRGGRSETGWEEGR